MIYSYRLNTFIEIECQKCLCLSNLIQQLY